MDNDLLRIGEIAGFFNVSVKALRIYEKMGIIKPVKIDSKTKYRYYNAYQVQQLDAVLSLKEIGFSLSEIKKLLDGGMTSEKFNEALVHKKTFWQNIVNSAENKISAIGEISDRLAASEPAMKMHELTDEERAWLVAKLVCVCDLHAQSALSEALWV